MASASAKVRVVTSVPALAALTREVGGSLVHVDSLASPIQDPHFVDGRPSLIVKLNKADLLVHVGLGLEVGWLPALVVNARNARIQPGQPGNLDASTECGPLLGAGGADRRFGDVHPGGNPHYLYDPRYGVHVARAITRRLEAIDGANAAAYRAHLARFEAEMAKRLAAWNAMMAPYRGRTIVGFHESLVYLTTWLGLKSPAFIEPLPGIAPGPKHLAKLILRMKSTGAKVIFTERWYNAETTRVVAAKTGARVVRLPGDVGAPGVPTYAALIDAIVRSLRDALDATSGGA